MSELARQLIKKEIKERTTKLDLANFKAPKNWKEVKGWFLKEG